MLPIHVNSKLPTHVSSHLALLFLPSMFLFHKKTQPKKKTPKLTAVVLGISQFLHIHNVTKGICAPVTPVHRTLKQKGSPWKLNGLNCNVLCNIKEFTLQSKQLLIVTIGAGALTQLDLWSDFSFLQCLFMSFSTSYLLWSWRKKCAGECLLGNRYESY